MTGTASPLLTLLAAAAGASPDVAYGSARWDAAAFGNHRVRLRVETSAPAAYAGRGRAQVAVPSWATEPVDPSLAIDWKHLGIDPARDRILAPGIEGFQEERRFSADSEPEK